MICLSPEVYNVNKAFINLSTEIRKLLGLEEEKDPAQRDPANTTASSPSPFLKLQMKKKLLFCLRLSRGTIVEVYLACFPGIEAQRFTK